jgi:hypothetical protein
MPNFLELRMGREPGQFIVHLLIDQWHPVDDTSNDFELICE